MSVRVCVCACACMSVCVCACDSVNKCELHQQSVKRTSKRGRTEKDRINQCTYMHLSNCVIISFLQ